MNLIFITKRCVWRLSVDWPSSEAGFMLATLDNNGGCAKTKGGLGNEDDKQQQTRRKYVEQPPSIRGNFLFGTVSMQRKDTLYTFILENNANYISRQKKKETQISISVTKV